jgi:hypothetical protein
MEEQEPLIRGNLTVSDSDYLMKLWSNRKRNTGRTMLLDAHTGDEFPKAEKVKPYICKSQTAEIQLLEADFDRDIQDDIGVHNGYHCPIWTEHRMLARVDSDHHRFEGTVVQLQRRELDPEDAAMYTPERQAEAWNILLNQNLINPDDNHERIGYARNDRRVRRRRFPYGDAIDYNDPSDPDFTIRVDNTRGSIYDNFRSNRNRRNRTPRL